MPAETAERTHTPPSRAAAPELSGRGGLSMPAVPALQQMKDQEAPARESAPLQGSSAPPVQRVREAEFTDNPELFMQKYVLLFDYGKGFLSRYPRTLAAVGGRIDETSLGARVKEVMARNKDKISFYLQDAGAKAADEKSIYYTTPALGLLPKTEIKEVFKGAAGYLDNADTLVDTLIAEDGGGDNIRANYAPYFTDNPNKTDERGGSHKDSFTNVGSTVVDTRTTNFVFTDAMNGCAYGITKVEGDDLKFEAWHFQSETDNFSQASHFRTVKKIRDWFGVNDYYVGAEGKGLAATNVIWNSGGGAWKMLSQKNIVDMNGSEKTVFKQADSHDLNVSEDIDEEGITGIHTKLIEGRRKTITAKRLKDLNDRLKALTLSGDPVTNSTKIFKVTDKSMSKPEAAEINRMAIAIVAKKLEGYPIDYTPYSKQVLLHNDLKAIIVKGLLSDGYNETRTLPIKQAFVVNSGAIWTAARTLLTDVKATTITADETELNQPLTNQLNDLEYFLDLYDSTSERYRDVNRLKIDVESLIRVKKGIASKGAELAAEKAALLAPPIGGAGGVGGAVPAEAPGEAPA